MRPEDLSDELYAATLRSPHHHGLRAMLEVCAAMAPPGMGCEFGVHRGDTLRRICAARQQAVFGFDSFDGLPAAWDRGTKVLPAGHFACTPPTDMPAGASLVIGRFSDTIPGWRAEHPGPVQLLHVDCDLYESAADVLNGLNGQIVPGTCIVFDELLDATGRYPNWREGEWRALIEWLSRCNRVVRPIGRADYEQAAFVVEV